LSGASCDAIWADRAAKRSFSEHFYISLVECYHHTFIFNTYGAKEN